MSSFEYLSVLISIILGLGISQLLLRLGQLIQAWVHEPKEVRPYWIQLVWTGLIFVAHVQFWWALFSRREEIEQYGFYTFLFLLLTPALLFLVSTLVLPEVERGAPVDLREYFFRSRGWVLGTGSLIPLLGLAEALWLRGQAMLSLSTGLQLGLGLLLGSAAVVESRYFHAAVAVLCAGLMLTFITLFSLHVA